MLEKPCHGWCHMHLFDVDIELSYLSYLSYDEASGPFEWLKACQFGLDNQLPVTLAFATEGKGDVILISDFTRTCLLPAPAIHTAELLTYDNYTVMQLVEEMITDINRDFESWITDWIALDGSHDLSEEDEAYIAEMNRIPGMAFRAYEKLEMRLKKALREMESAWLRRSKK